MKIITLLMFFIISINIYSKSDDIVQPKFPGGDTALTQYLSKTIVYPAEAIKQKWDGKTLVAFTINEDGSITNVHIIKSSWTLLDDEAMRVVKLMPNWIPAKENGINKKEMVILPVSFDLFKTDVFYKSKM
jgi:TonB family protein